jgi:glycosyltransferase involved in cell wall biosynthesis
MPTYNRPEMLATAIQSVLSQTYSNYEIIVINDFGVNVENVVSSLNKKRNILYIKHNSNKGLASARNTGIKNAVGKYIAYLDDDDVFYPNHIATLVKHLETNNCDAAYTDAYRATQVWQNNKYIVLEKNPSYSCDFDYDRILIENFIPVLCVMHRKECINNVGMFDENLPRAEDWDLWIRMSRVYQFSHITEITCEFSWRDDGTSMMTGEQVSFDWAFLNMFHKYGNFAEGKSKIIGIHGDIIAEAAGRLEEAAKRSLDSDKENSHRIFRISQIDKTISTFHFLKEKYPDNILAINRIIDLLTSRKTKSDQIKEESHGASIPLISTQSEWGEKVQQSDNEYNGNLQDKMVNLQKRILDLEKKLKDLHESRGWKLLGKYYDLRDLLFPKSHK